MGNSSPTKSPPSTTSVSTTSTTQTTTVSTTTTTTSATTTTSNPSQTKTTSTTTPTTTTSTITTTSNPSQTKTTSTTTPTTTTSNTSTAATSQRLPVQRTKSEEDRLKRFVGMGVKPGITSLSDNQGKNLFNLYYETIQRGRGSNTQQIKLVTKPNATKFVKDFSQAINNTTAISDPASVVNDCGTTYGGFNEEQFQVLLWKVTSKFKVSVPKAMKPRDPETMEFPYHSYHPLKAIKGVKEHICNLCTKEVSGECYRCDDCDYDCCMNCIKKDDFEKNKAETLEKMIKVREELMKHIQKNDLHHHFNVPTNETLTTQLLEKKYREVTRNCHNAISGEIQDKVAHCNLLREIYCEISQKEELMKIYNSYLPYRKLCSTIEKVPGLLLDLFKQLTKIKDHLKEILEKEESLNQSSPHPLLEEIMTYLYCIEIWLRFMDPLCPVLPRRQKGGDSGDGEPDWLLLLAMLGDPALPNELKKPLLGMMLSDPNVPPNLKLLLLLAISKSV